MILPERVFGSPSTNWILSGVAMALMSLRTASRSSFASYTTGYGSFQVQGYHYASVPGYLPGYAYSFYYFEV